MPTINELGLTFNMPNYTGEVLTVTPGDTPFLTAIGGLNGQGEVVMATEFEGQTQDLDEPQQPEHTEGGDAPGVQNATRANWSNITQIFHYAFGVSYTAEAARQQLAGLNVGGTRNPVASEIDYQSTQKLMKAARDMNFTFLNGSYQKPGSNATGRRTRGLIPAITTNAKSNLGPAIAVAGAASTDAFTANGHGLTNGQAVRLSALAGGLAGITAGIYYVRDAATNTFKLASVEGGAAVNVTADGTATAQLLTPLTAIAVQDLIQSVWTSHGFSQALEPTLIVNASLKRALTKLFITDKNYREERRDVGGVSLTAIETEFGRLNVMLERNAPAHVLTFAHLALIKPAYLMIPDRGFLFVEELAKTGASRKFQLYGEAGLWHGPEQAHAKISDAGFVVGA